MGHACPKDGQPLAPDAKYGEVCARCSGVLVADDVLEARHPRATLLLEVETDERSPALAVGWECPGCRHMLAPWRIRETAVHAYRCGGCSWSFVPRQSLGVLVQKLQKRAAADAYNSLPEAERKELARDLASSEERPQSLSAGHTILALLGFPVVSNIERRRTPIVTFALAGAIVLVFLWQLSAGIDLSALELGYQSGDPSLWAAFRAVFLHAGWFHLIGNVYFLIAFGDGVEQRLSRPTLIGFFAGAGALTLVLDGLLASRPTLIVGASGGVAVLIGACVVLQPQARVVTSLANFVFRTSIVVYGVIELGYQLVMSMLGVAGVAWVAHLTGLAIGLALGMVARFSQPATK